MNRYRHQLFSILGDSVSTYEGYLPKGHLTFYTPRDAYYTNIYGWRDTWWGQVIAHFQGELLVNNSWSGSFVCRSEEMEVGSYGCSEERTGGLGVEGTVPDQILVYIGTNDRGKGFPLTSEDKSDLAVIENAYGVMLDKIRKNYPKAEIWCLTYPITTCTGDPDYRFWESFWGIPTERYGEVVAQVAKSRGCHVIDLWDPEQPCDTFEGLHYNYNGMCTIAKKVIRAMEGAE